MSTKKREPLPAGAVIEYCGEHAVVVDDPGGDGRITVQAGDYRAQWRWSFEGVSCTVVSLPGQPQDALPAEPARAPLIELALARALQAYAGKQDKAGQPYILHPLRLMARLSDPIAQVVALLHDVIEDSDTTAEDLAADGFPPEVVHAVQLLTRGEGETYEDFIERIRPHRLPRTVKLADIEDNLNVLRLITLAPADLRRVEKYHRAWHRLNSAEGEAV